MLQGSLDTTPCFSGPANYIDAICLSIKFIQIPFPLLHFKGVSKYIAQTVTHAARFPLAEFTFGTELDFVGRFPKGRMFGPFGLRVFGGSRVSIGHGERAVEVNRHVPMLDLHASFNSDGTGLDPVTTEFDLASGVFRVLCQV